MGISFRPITDTDEFFLRELYASTRAEELSHVDWPAEQIRLFLDQQFTAQHIYYQQHFAGAEFSIIELDGERIGRQYVALLPEEILIIDFALLPEQRNQGLGAKLVRDIMEEARRKKLPLRIHVEHLNRAKRFWERLGFQQIEDQGVHAFMEWRA